MKSRSLNPALFFSKKEKKRIITAVQEAESKTSGEIRVHLDHKAGEDVLARAKEIFEKIGMARTEARNSVLIFLDVKKRRFAILGDKGIDEKVSKEFWNDVAAQMGRHCRQDRFADGIVEAVQLIGEKLQEHFPYQRKDINELPDEISYSLSGCF